MEDMLSDSDVGLLDDSQVGIDSNGAAPPQGEQSFMSDEDVGLLSDDEVGVGSRPAPEGFPARTARTVAHTAAPAAAGYFGAATGAELGSAFGPIGTIAGGLAGALVSSYATSKAQQAGLDAIGIDDSEQVAANRNAHPYETFATEIATNMAGMGPAAGAGKLVRGASAALQGGLEAGQEYATEGKVSPSKVLTAAAAGAVLPGTNRLGEKFTGPGQRMGAKLAKRIPGRPNASASPDAEAAQDEAQTSPPPNVARGVASEKPAPDIDGDTIGNPQSRPTVGDAGRNLAKGAKPASEATDMLTQGDYSPDVAAALNAFRNAGNADLGNPKVDIDASLKEAPIQTGFPQRPNQGGVAALIDRKLLHGLPGETHADLLARHGISLDDFDISRGDNVDLFHLPSGEIVNRGEMARRGLAESGEDLRDFGLRPTAEQMATPSEAAPVSENPVQISDTAPPTPPNPNAAKPTLGLKKPAPEAILSDADVGLVSEQPKPVGPAPEAAPSETVHPDAQKVADVREHVAQPTPAQAEAGNYAKGHPGRLFGRDVSIETPKGGVREDTKSTPPKWRVENFPYDYGEFLGTKGADGDRVDVGVLGTGDRHFVIDQKDPATGKFDEHKVMAYAKDPVDALEHYHRAFNDGSGPDRVLSIKEATADELKDWLAKPGKKSKPFDEAAAESAGPTEGEKPLPKVVTAAVTKLRDNAVDGQVSFAGRTMPVEEAVKALQDMEPSARIGVASRYINGTAAVPARPDRIRTAAPKVEGLTVSAKDKASAAGKSKNIKVLDDAFEATSPTDGEDKAATIARAKDFLERAKAADFTMKGAAKPYRPSADNHAPTVMEREARKLLRAKNPSDKAVEAFRAQEKLLRSGGEGVAEARATSRIESDIGLSKRSGDEAIAGAEAERATHNSVEDDIIDAIDRANASKGEFDVPHEEAESMVRPEPATPESIAEERTATKHLDTNNPSDRAALAAALVQKRSTNKGGMVGSSKTGVALGEGSTPENPKASAVRKIDPKTLDPEYIKRLLEGASAPRPGSRLDSADIVKMTKEARDPTTKSLGRLFMDDEAGALNLDKIIADIQKFKAKVKASDYWKHQKLESHIARPAKSAAEQYARSLSNEAVKVIKGNEQQLIDLQHWSKSLPKELNNPATLRRLYDAREAGTIGNLDPKEQALYNKYLEPLFNENDALYEAAKTVLPKHLVAMLGEKVEGDHAMRIPAGEKADRNMFVDDERDDPIVSGRQGLPVRPVNTMLERKFYAMEDPKGNRFLIAANDDGFTVWHNRKPIKVTDENFEYAPGKQYTVGGKTFTMKKALTSEIEDHALFGPGEKAKYYHNAALSAAMANYDLGRILRYNKFVEGFKEDPEFLKYARAPGAKAPDNYLPTKLANFDGWKFDPQLAYALDDMAQPGINEGAVAYIRRISQAITKTIFWLPVAHLANVGGHWFVGRGQRWAVPKSYLSLADTSLKAIKSVIAQDDFQKAIRQNGGSTIYSGVLTQDAVNNLARGFGEAVRKQPARWDPIARKFGVGPSDLVRAVYKASSRVMWAGNDMFLTQAIMERMNEGMDIDQAIIHAERHIPNYRVPSTVLGTGAGARVVAQLLLEPAATVFGRYHWGIMNSYGNTIRDLVKGNGAAKIDALGHLFAMGLLGLVIYPALDAAAKYITGNKGASQQRRGPISVPAHIVDALRGKEDITAPLKSLVTPSPLLTAVLQAKDNRDYRGKPIVERGLVAQAAKGNLRAGGQAAVEAGEFAARNLFSPYNTYANTVDSGHSVAGGLRDQMLDIKNPSRRSVAYSAKTSRYNMQSLRQRNRSGRGPLEGLYTKATR